MRSAIRLIRNEFGLTEEPGTGVDNFRNSGEGLMGSPTRACGRSSSNRTTNPSMIVKDA